LHGNCTVAIGLSGTSTRKRMRTSPGMVFVRNCKSLLHVVVPESLGCTKSQARTRDHCFPNLMDKQWWSGARLPDIGKRACTTMQRWLTLLSSGLDDNCRRLDPECGCRTCSAGSPLSSSVSSSSAYAHADVERDRRRDRRNDKATNIRAGPKLTYSR